MKKFLLAMFSESGNVSMIRVLSFVCVMTACGIAIAAVSLNRDINAISVLCGTFLGIGIGGKVMQKGKEK